MWPDGVIEKLEDAKKDSLSDMKSKAEELLRKLSQ